jgi:hypothetical protein
VKFSSLSNSSQGQIDDLTQQVEQYQAHNQALQDTIGTQQQKLIELTGTVTLQQQKIDSLNSLVRIQDGFLSNV